jgi:hypothetical protein
MTLNRISSLRWAGHVEMMGGEDILKRIVGCNAEGRSRIDRPKRRWIDGVLEDVKKRGIKEMVDS